MNDENHADEGREIPLRIERLEAEITRLRSRVERLEGPAVSEAKPDEADVSKAGSGRAEVPSKSDKEPVRESEAQPQSEPPPLPPERPVEPPPIKPPVPPPPRRAAPPPLPAAPSPARAFLSAMHLLPPREGSGEVQLGAWWATRIGAVLAVIGVVFFGVYVSIGTPPWVKLTELGVVSVVVSLAGIWFCRRLPKFGAVVLGAGLALVYFTAFAAYAIPPVKVTDSLAVAAGLQIAAVALVFGVALVRKAQTVATMATLLGFVSAFLSVAEGFDDFAVFGALALAAVAAVLRRSKGWAWPLGAAAVLTHVVYVAVASAIWDSETGRRSIAFVFSVLGGGFGLVFLSAVLEGPGAEGKMARAQRWIQSLNAPLAVVAGFVAALIVLPDGGMASYFFGAGAVLFVSAVWMWRLAPADALFSMFGVKAAALIALGVCTEWGERTRWVVLAVEAFLVLAAGQRTRRPSLYHASAIVWAASLAFFLDDADRLRGAMGSWGGMLALVFGVAGPLFFALFEKAWPRDRGTLPRFLLIVFAWFAAVPAVQVGGLVFSEAWGPVAMLAMSLLLIAVYRLLRTGIPLPAAAIAMLYAHASVHGFRELDHGTTWLWVGAASVAAATAALGWRASEVEAPRREGWTESWRLLGTVLVAAALVALSAGFYQSMPVPIAAGVAALLAAAVAWQGAGSARTALVGAGVLALGASALMTPVYLRMEHDPAGGTIGPWLAGIGAILVFGALVQPGDARERLEKTRWITACAIIAGAANVLLLWKAVDETVPVGWMPWAIVGLAVVFQGLGQLRRSGAAIAVASVLLLLLIGDQTTGTRWPPRAVAWSALAGAWIAGAIYAAIPAVTLRWCPWVSGRWMLAWKVMHAVVGMLFLLHLAVLDHVPWEPVASVIWAAGGIVVFFLGLFLRSRPHRVVGLLALAGCIVRVFAVDINSTLYRIAAFVALGVVLLWVGFSYQRFRHFIENDEPAGGKESKDPANPAA